MVEDISTFSSEYMDFNSFPLRDLGISGLSFYSLAFKDAEKLATLETKGWNTIHSPRNERSSVILVDTFNPLMSFVVCDAISGR